MLSISQSWLRSPWPDAASPWPGLLEQYGSFHPVQPTLHVADPLSALQEELRASHELRVRGDGQCCYSEVTFLGAH